MEKLNIRFLTPIVAAILVAFTSSAFAGQGFRFSSKQPVYKEKRMKGYLFGYGGWDSGATFDTTGNYHVPGNYYGGNYVPNPTNIPIDFDLDSGFALGGGVGFYSSLLNGTRFEFEGSFNRNDAGFLLYQGFELPGNFDMETRAFMFNMLKEIPLGEHGVTGYFGGGVGYAETEMFGDIAGVGWNDRDSGFAWQLIAGVDFPITESLALFMQYRYRVLSEMAFTTDFGDFTNITDENPYSHGVMIGARVSF